jgi:hypoxanthine phosphoribosyltransferase
MEIGDWAKEVYQEKDQPLLAVCVLRGAVLFFSDLIRAIPLSVEPAFCRTWSYSSKENAQMRGVRVSVESVEAAGRSILIVDDICDTGATLKKLHQVFTNLGAAEVRTAVMIHRLIDNAPYNPDWSGFRYEGSEWFVGYGMEDCNRLQNLSDVYTITPS